MDRRKFLGSLAAGVSLAFLGFTTIGCSQSQLVALTQVLGQDGANVALALGNTGLSTEIANATTAAVAAITGWKSGTAAQNVIQALGILEQDLNLIPIASPYTPLIDLAIGTVQSILALLPTPTPQVASAVRIRQVHLAKPAPKTAKEYKAQRAALVAVYPALATVVK